MAQKTIWIDATLKQRLKIAAAEVGLSMSAIADEALTHYLPIIMQRDRDKLDDQHGSASNQT
ncbi:MAG: hypothetical protein ACR2P1_26785 [Pseudomonadales bacterium]